MRYKSRKQQTRHNAKRPDYSPRKANEGKRPIQEKARAYLNHLIDWN